LIYAPDIKIASNSLPSSTDIQRQFYGSVLINLCNAIAVVPVMDGDSTSTLKAALSNASWQKQLVFLKSIFILKRNWWSLMSTG